MSANNKQASNGPIPCKAGCGFFGSEATGGCCSKCWMSTIKKQTPPARSVTADADVVDSERTTTTNKNTELSSTSKIAATTLKTAAITLDVDQTTITTPAPAPSVTAPLKKKKKKKTGYKNMMASMMTGSEKDVAKEKEILAKGLGGGAFSKVEKI